MAVLSSETTLCYHFLETKKHTPQGKTQTQIKTGQQHKTRGYLENC